MTEPVRIVVVDDSLLYRMTIRKALLAIDNIEVVGSAADGTQALDRIEEFDPDLVTLDVQMPGMDGIEVLREMKRRGHRASAVMVSSLTTRGARATTDALLEGAFDFLLKPSGSDPEKNLRALRNALSDKIAAWRARRRPAPTGATLAKTQRPPATVRSITPRRPVEVVVVGTSTGGPEALRSLLPGLTEQLHVPILVVQHMPTGYTAALAERLDELCPQRRVREATDGMELCADDIVIAPGGRHLKVALSHQRLRARVTDDPPENACRPAVDYLLRSSVQRFEGRALAVILTGMGRDGTAACRELKQQGGVVLAQDQATSTVFGMPGSVIKEGLADAVVPLERMADAIRRVVRAR